MVQACLPRPRSGPGPVGRGDTPVMKDSQIVSTSPNTNALNEMLKRVQHDKKKRVIPNLFRNLEFGDGNKSIAFALIPHI
jgi:hypothetical protein